MTADSQSLPDHPIKVITFDLYDTLVEAEDTRWDRMGRVFTELGFDHDRDRLIYADRAAEDHYTIENGRLPIRDRDASEVDAFRIANASVWLRETGLPDDLATSELVRNRYRGEIGNYHWTYRVFDEVTPVLESLRDAGIKRAVISNADADVTEFCLEMGFSRLMDVIVTSALVGWEKPDPRTFHAALDALDIPPGDALHVGDQALSDVVGARAIGMSAALIDRYRRHRDDEHDVPVVRSLMELAELVIAHNAQFPGTR